MRTAVATVAYFGYSGTYVNARPVGLYLNTELTIVNLVAFASLRLFAIYRQNIKIAIFVMCLFMVEVVGHEVSRTKVSSLRPPLK